jgi:hypothetical protein
MGFTLDNQTLLYIVIALFIVQFLVTRYYVNSAVEDGVHKNNKKMIKKLTHQIGSTFDHYVGGGGQGAGGQPHSGDHSVNGPRRSRGGYSGQDMDSIDDPAEDAGDDCEGDDEDDRRGSRRDRESEDDYE